MRRYSPKTIPTSTTLAQTQRWLRDEHNLLADSLDSAATELGGAYGGISFSGSQAVPNITTSYSTMDQFDQETFAPRGVEYDLSAGGIKFLVPGLWLVNVNITYGHNVDSSGERELFVRVLDTFNQVGSFSMVGSIGRSSALSTFQATSLAPIEKQAVGHLLQLQWRADATVSSVVINQTRWQVSAQALSI